MRWDNLLLVIMLGLAGCARNRSPEWSQPVPTGNANNSRPSAVIVTPAEGNRGRIVSVNPTARHVVITYPIGLALPAEERRLNVYRAGLKVAEVKVSKERMDVNLVADITSGDCQVGDEVRED